MEVSAQQAKAMGPAGGCQACQAARPPAQSQQGPGSVAVVNPAKSSWIVVELLNDEGRPMTGERVLIELPKGEQFEGALDKNGRIRVEGIDPGTCTISFPDRERADWARA